MLAQKIDSNFRPPRKRRRALDSTCKAQGGPVHLGDRDIFSGFCAQHNPEYQAHRKLYNDMVYNLKRGRTKKVPPATLAQYLAAVTWSPFRGHSIIITPDVRNRIEFALTRLLAARGDLANGRSAKELPEGIHVPELFQAIAGIETVLGLIGVPSH